METQEYIYTVEEDIVSGSFSDSSSDMAFSHQIDLSSIYSHEMDEVDRSYGVDLVNLDGIIRQMDIHFSNAEYQSVLLLIPKLNRYAFVPSSVRIIIALSLFSLGRIGGALREIALVIEMNNNPMDRERYINHLISFFGKLEMPEKAVSCFNEIIAIAQIEIALNREKVDYVKELSAKLIRYEGELACCRKGQTEKRTSRFVQMNYSSLHEQAEAYLACDGHLESYSVGRLCISTNSMITQLKALLKKNQKSKIGTPDETVITLLFDIIRALAPSYLYDKIKNDIPSINSCIEQHIGMSRDQESFKSVFLVVEEIEEHCVGSNKSYTGLFKYLVLSNIIKGFIELLAGNFQYGISIFEWSIDLIEEISKKLNSSATKIDYLSQSTKSVIAVLICQCYEFGGINCDDGKLSALFVSLLKATNNGSKSEYSSGRLSHYFISFGLMFERSAYNQATKIVIEDQDSKAMDTALRLCQKSIQEMIRKYILAVVNRSSDDPSICILYDRIIWGILLCGGLHLKTLWFFISLKNYFLIEADFGPLQLQKRDDYKVFAKDDILSTYANGWELVDKILSMWSSLDAEEKANLWSIENGSMFLIPQIYDGKGRLILIDQYYDEHIRNSSIDFIRVSPFHVEHKLKGHLKLHKRIITERIATSKDLILLWCTSFQESHGALPCIASEFLPDL